jgi:hypothetical protein
MIAMSEKFLAKHLGGRYQESMTPEVQKRLGEITVDPRTVVLASPSSGNGASGDVSGKWILDVDAGGQIIQVTLELKHTPAGMTGTMASPAGGGTVEKGSLNGKDLSVTLRGDVQGQASEIQLDGKLDGDKLSGSIVVSGLGSFPFTGARPK